MKKCNLIFLLAILAAMTLSACSSKEVTNSETTSKTEVTSEIEVNSETTMGSNVKFNEIQDNSVFNVNWNTTDGELMAGTASCVQVDFSEEPILITAFHYFEPENATSFTGSDMKDYVLGGQIIDIIDDGDTNASIKDVIVLKDAAPVPDINHDLAAFHIEGTENITPLKFAEEMPKTGDSVYLLASLWDTEDVNENRIYEGKVLSIEDDVLYYDLDKKYGTTGASGAPIVNDNGEIVAIHIGSSDNIRVGHSKDSIYKMLKSAVEE